MYTDDMTMLYTERNSTCGCEPAETVCGESANACDERSCAWRKTWGLMQYPLGMVYAPLQRFDNIYDLDTALMRGTVFGELDLPFICGEKSKGGCCGD